MLFGGLGLDCGRSWRIVGSRMRGFVEAASFEAQARREAFRDWFSGASVAAYASLAEFETSAARDSKLEYGLGKYCMGLALSRCLE